MLSGLATACSGGSIGNVDTPRGGSGGAAFAGAENGGTSFAGQTPTGGASTGGNGSSSTGGAAPNGRGGISAGAGSGGRIAGGGSGGTRPSSGGAGGSSGAGTGGVKGMGGMPQVVPPPVPVTCDTNLAIGKWQNVSPPEFRNPSNMETLAVAIDPTDGTVYAAAGNKTNGGDSGTGVMKSSDCGGTFKLASTGRNKAELQSGDPWALLINTKTPSTIYVNNGYGNTPILFRSTNRGIDFDAMNIDPDNVVQYHFVQAMALDPKDPTHLVVTFHENCTGQYKPVCFSQSSDGGDSWHMFNGPPSLSDWNEGASITVLGPNSYFYTGQGGWFTGDGGNTWSEPIKVSIFGSYGGGALLASDGKLYLGVTNDGVYQSTGNTLGAAWTKIANSPQTSVMMTDGTNLYASWTQDNGGRPYYTAPLNNLTKWTNMPSDSCNRGANMYAYDPVHHMVYAASWGAGLWRLVTQ